MASGEEHLALYVQLKFHCGRDNALAVAHDLGKQHLHHATWEDAVVDFGIEARLRDVGEQHQAPRCLAVRFHFVPQ